jgi:acyl-CoA thioester hydrolase
MSDFYIEKKIYYHDTDSGGVVYYANYLEYLEEGRSEYCASKGINLKNLADSGTYFVVRHVEIDYKSPARYQDLIRIYTRVEKVGNASIDFWQGINRDNVTLVETRTTWVCVSREFKPKLIPAELKQLFS